MMTTLENIYFGNINPSEYKQSNDTRKKLEQIDSCQLSLIALSERDAYIEGFKLGVKMTTEIYADTQQWG